VFVPDTSKNTHVDHREGESDDEKEQSLAASGPPRTSRSDHVPCGRKHLAQASFLERFFRRMGVTTPSSAERRMPPQIPADSARQNFSAAFRYSAACALVTSVDAVCVSSYSFQTGTT